MVWRHLKICEGGGCRMSQLPIGEGGSVQSWKMTKFLLFFKTLSLLCLNMWALRLLIRDIFSEKMFSFTLLSLKKPVFAQSSLHISPIQILIFYPTKSDKDGAGVGLQLCSDCVLQNQELFPVISTWIFCNFTIHLDYLGHMRTSNRGPGGLSFFLPGMEHGSCLPESKN